MRNIIKFSGIAVAVFILASCTSQKNLIYFQNDELDSNIPDEQVYNYPQGHNNASPEYRLQPHDMLYIQIYSSMDEETNKLFSGSSSSNSNYAIGSETGIFLNSYEVNDEGNITLPVVGDITVTGMTIDEVKEKIRIKAEEYSKGIVVSCRMVTFKIKVAGEINRPGIYTFYQPSVDIFDALLAAGDLTYDGNRSKIRVVRKTATEDVVYTLDIRKASVMRDPHYYLRPGDIVYVEPNKNTKNLTYLNRPLSTIGSIASVITAFVTVILAIHNATK
ncbi:MAG: polysaccharide biosynthesis/export family protein [Bacteroidales bacterium]|nr:polysaccharide biosynthesis/export family protein [Bacteroidales bacterium]